MPIDPSTAFVCYSHEDLEFVFRLAKDLKAKGAKVWMDRLDLRPGQLWDSEVELAVDACSRMLVILSPAAAASQKVKNEFMAAMDEGKEVIPVYIRDCRVPLQLRRFQYADFRNDYEVGLAELLASLSGAGIATPDGPKAEAEERAHLEKDRKLLENAETATEVAQAEQKRREEGVPARLAAKGDLKQLEQAEADRLNEQAKAERMQREQAEAERLAAAAEARRKQQEESERHRLAALSEPERETEEDRARETALARQRLAAEQGRQRLDPQKAQAPRPSRNSARSLYPGWVNGGIAVIALVAVGLLVYWESSGSHRTDPAVESPKQQVNSETPAPGTTTEPVPNGLQTSPPGTGTKSSTSKPKTSIQAASSRPPAGVQSRAVTPNKAASNQTATNALLFTDPKTAEFYRKAQAGDSTAMVNLSQAYYDGNGVSRDYNQVYTWDRKAAEAGSSRGMFNLGVDFENGFGVGRDYTQAVTWYHKAAEAGDAQAMNNLGVAYEHGYGVGKDYAQAVTWYRKAADGGDAQAMNNLGAMYASGNGVGKDDTQAVTWYRKAAEAGVAQAMNTLGIAYEKGYGVGKDDTQAVTWYRKAAEAGYAEAMSNLGAMYVNGYGVERDYQQALGWFRKSALAGNADGTNNLGACYENGWAVQQDKQQAITWYRKAAKLGSDKAKENLKRLGQQP